MSVTLIEGLLLLTAAGIGGIMWWGVQRLISANDETVKALGKIQEHLATINGRLGKSETWMELHQAQDDKQYEALHVSVRDLYEKVNIPRS
jgi:hypothetical protein